MSSNFTSSWHFAKPWRPYQAQVLEDLEEALENGRAHIVAAPGSGKTVLGLEIGRRLSKPMLVLAPTITVREQWVHRLCTDFLTSSEVPDWISRDLVNPAAFTVATYQSLSSAFKRPGGRKRIRERLAAAGFGTLVLDEAHHLRGHWWTCLERLREDFPDVLIVALTATPPYDVPQSEWNRYAALCGTIDAEISAPELVREGNLCPHQDYLYFTEPVPEELAEVERFDLHRDRVLTELRTDIEGAECLSRHPLFSCGLPPRKEILADLDWFLSVVLYLREVGGRVPIPLEDALELRGVELPDLDLHWLQVFLQGLLFDRKEEMGWYAPLKPHLRRIRSLLSDTGAIEQGRVLLLNSNKNRRLLATSPSKIAAVAEILEAELAEMGAGLRAVVLADYIRDEILEPGADIGGRTFEKLGVVPIFEALRRREIPLLLPAVLTGRLVIVPRTSVAALEEALCDLGDLGARPLEHAPGFVCLNVDDTIRHRMVHAVTEVFGSGDLNVLVGTAALLGEGWDAPETNTLVLASSIGSFMTSNQMRGRAIRQDPRDPEKAANIWHLACVAGSGEVVNAGSADVESLRRRFGSYAGLTLVGDPPQIAEGFERMGLPERRDAARLLATNPETLRLAADRIALRERWRKALPPRDVPARFRPIREVAVQHPSLAVRVGTRGGWLAWIPFVGGALARMSRDRILRKRIGEVRGYSLAVLGALQTHHAFHEAVEEHQVVVGPPGRGEDLCVRLAVESAADQRRFANALCELFEVLRQPAPRYLLRSKNRWFAVPSELDGHRDHAEIFLAFWRRHVRRRGMELHYAHGEKGRAAMLEAKRDALLGRFTWTSAGRTRWG